MSTATGSFKLAPMKRSLLTFQEQSFGSGKSSPGHEAATVWKRQEEKKPDKANKTVTFDVADKGNSAITDEEPTEEELLKQGIHLARRLSSDGHHRDFNWDDDDGDDSSWPMNNAFLPLLNPSKEEEAKEDIPPSPKLVSSSPPWKITQPHNVAPIDKQLKELSERRHQQPPQQHPHYSHVNDLWQQREHDTMNSRYRFNDHEKRYRSDDPLPRPEVFNESTGQIETVQRRLATRPTLHRAMDQPPNRVADPENSIEEHEKPLEKLIEKPKKSIIEEQEEVMRLARENARKRKEEEQKREKELQEASKRKAEELVAKLAAKHKEEHPEEQFPVKPILPPKQRQGSSSFADENPAFRAVSSVIGEGGDMKMRDSKSKLWSGNNNTGLWNASTGRSPSADNLWGPMTGIYKSNKSENKGMFQPWALGANGQHFTPVKGENWKAPLSPDPSTSPVQSVAERPVAESPSVSRGTSRFFPTQPGESKENNNIFDVFPRTMVATSGMHDLGLADLGLADLVPDSNGNGNGNNNNQGSSTNVPRVILPPTGRVEDPQSYKAPSLNSIQALQSTIAEKLGSKVVNSPKPWAAAPALPIPASPIVASNIPPESSTTPPALVPKEPREAKRVIASFADAAASGLVARHVKSVQPVPPARAVHQPVQAARAVQLNYAVDAIISGVETQARSSQLEEAVLQLFGDTGVAIRLAVTPSSSEEAVSFDANWDRGLIAASSSFSESSFYYESGATTAANAPFLREFKPRKDILVAILIPGGTKITTKFRQVGGNGVGKSRRMAVGASSSSSSSASGYSGVNLNLKRKGPRKRVADH